VENIFKKAAGLFVEFDETPPNPLEKSGPNPAPSPFAESQSPTGLEKVGSLARNFEKFQTHFSKLLEDNNLPGTDYYEFLKVLESLQKHIPDEKTRFTAGYASLAITGLTKEKLLESTKFYSDLIFKDKENFLKSLISKQEEEVTAREKRAFTLNNKIADNSQAIQKLTKEIADAQTEISKLSEEKSAATERLKSNQEGYLTVSEAMLNKIKNDAAKIEALI